MSRRPRGNGPHTVPEIVKEYDCGYYKKTGYCIKRHDMCNHEGPIETCPLEPYPYLTKLAKDKEHEQENKETISTEFEYVDLCKKIGLYKDVYCSIKCKFSYEIVKNTLYISTNEKITRQKVAIKKLKQLSENKIVEWCGLYLRNNYDTLNTINTNLYLLNNIFKASSISDKREVKLLFSYNHNENRYVSNLVKIDRLELETLTSGYNIVYWNKDLIIYGDSNNFNNRKSYEIVKNDLVLNNTVKHIEYGEGIVVFLNTNVFNVKFEYCKKQFLISDYLEKFKKG